MLLPLEGGHSYSYTTTIITIITYANTYRVDRRASLPSNITTTNNNNATSSTSSVPPPLTRRKTVWVNSNANSNTNNDTNITFDFATNNTNNSNNTNSNNTNSNNTNTNTNNIMTLVAKHGSSLVSLSIECSDIYDILKIQKIMNINDSSSPNTVSYNDITINVNDCVAADIDTNYFSLFRVLLLLLLLLLRLLILLPLDSNSNALII